MSLHLAHVAIGVKDMERSLALYRDILGFVVVSDFMAEGDQVDQMVNLKRAKIRIVLLQQEVSIIELCHYFSPEVQGNRDLLQCDPGIIHFAFITDQFTRIVNQLRENNYPLFSEPLDLGFIEGLGKVQALYFYGPDREAIELLEITEERREDSGRGAP